MGGGSGWDLQLKSGQKSAKRTNIKARNSGKKTVKIARKVSPKKLETPELRKVFKRLNEKAQNREEAAKIGKNITKMADYVTKKSCEKSKHKQGIKAKIEAFEQLKGLEARKLDFYASSTSSVNSKEIVFSQSGRGGHKPPNRRKPKLSTQNNTILNYWGPDKSYEK